MLWVPSVFPWLLSLPWQSSGDFSVTVAKGYSAMRESGILAMDDSSRLQNMREKGITAMDDKAVL